jgi:hypothetical protein
MHLKTVCLALVGCLCLNPTRGAETTDDGFFPFVPAPDEFRTGCVIDLRSLNESFAGEGGWIEVRDGHFVHGKSGEPLRFWAVNGPSPSAKTSEQLRREARVLAKYGVNLVRIQGAVFDEQGEPDLSRVRLLQATVNALKAEGIYTELSIYFPLWFKPAASLPWLKGYDGSHYPFAALLFNPEFQAKYRQWWEAVLLTRDDATGQRLLDEPAVFGLELQNEDSFFFWTFDERNLPEPQLRLLEGQFGTWLTAKYGSLWAAFHAWNCPALPRDAFAEGRAAIRPLNSMGIEKQVRDQDTTRFLYETQAGFYARHRAFLRKLGYRGLVTAGNWTTANAEVFGPLEKMSYAVGDFIDRHGYFECDHKGENAAWSIRVGQTYSDRSALRFDGEAPGKPKLFSHPSMDVKYAGLPSMISETTWCRPNRFRGEAPLYLAAFGALQDSDAIVHYAFDGSSWSVHPNYWMQPWTLMSPAMMGQFPAAALIFRKGLIKPGELLADLQLNRNDLLALKGTSLPQDAALDELRIADVPKGRDLKPGQRIDPLIHYAGQTRVTFTLGPTSIRLRPLGFFIDHERRQICASNGQLRLDYGEGLLCVDAPQVQGFSGKLDSLSGHRLHNLELTSPLDLGHLILVSLDGRPIESSRRLLLQVMSEEKTSGFATEPAGENRKRITDIGTDPWRVKRICGHVVLLLPNADSLRITALDLNGYPTSEVARGPALDLRADTLYYLIEQP